MSRLPSVTPELLEYLEDLFPNEAPTKSDLTDPMTVAFKAGQVDVVTTLKNIYEENTGDVLRKQA